MSRTAPQPASRLPSVASPVAASSRRILAPLRKRRTAGSALSLDDFEALARRYLPRCIFGYIAGAAETNASLHANRAAFGEWSFIPCVLRDVSKRTQRTDLFGTQYASPFGIAPMGLLALSSYRGDVAMATAAAQANIPFVISSTSLIPLEHIVRLAPESWLQAYLSADKARTDALLERAMRAGVRTLVVTVDIPVAGNRENNIRAGFSTPLRLRPRLAWDGLTHPRWTLGTLLRTLAGGMPHFENSFAERGAPIISRHAERDFSGRDSFSWGDIAHIRKKWKGTLMIKGLLSAADAAIASASGVDGIIVSNHGGRQLDGAASALRVLPEIVTAAGGMPVLLDGGVRRGTDVLKALALGARMVFAGRPFNYALAAGGADGVANAIKLLQNEIDRDMAMLGVESVEELSRDHLLRVDRQPVGR